MNKTGTLQPHTPCGMPATLHILAIEALGLTPHGIRPTHSHPNPSPFTTRLANHSHIHMGMDQNRSRWLGPAFNRKMMAIVVCI